MTIPTNSMITRPGAHSAKSARQAGAPNTQQSGENPMVGTRFNTDHPVRMALIEACAELAGQVSTLQDVLDIVTRESDLREQEVIALTVERDEALNQVADLEARLSELDDLAPFRHAGGQPCYGCQSCLSEFDDSDECGGEW